ncbi:hypothetical protein OBO34_20875 [Clostridiales Family XIII bacterium ASD5510]|uniref:Uncharacterized protein n=1 Tax=Hominibacterium faecale TaxID=2839743 RepID=A0A9J6QZ12_9FIRM|nr:hypothetical protein [Hominibacterium faecale]MCU7380771.1 hypothetical protein [Hominibacterium faecale]
MITAIDLMNTQDSIEILKQLKSNYEKGWGVLGKNPGKQMEEYAQLSKENEMFWRQLYIRGLATAIDELEKSVSDFIESDVST